MGPLQRLLLSAACLLAASLPAGAQDYPQRPITLVVAYAAGGPSDTSARAIVDRMSAILGQQLVVENVAGAGGMTGAARVARAEPDGYTLLIHQTGLAIGPALYPKLPFDVEKDLRAVGLVNTTYSFLIGRKNLPADDIDGLLAWMKGKGPGRPAKFAHPGVGTLAHLQAVLFVQLIGAEVDLIPYRGGGPAMNDIIGGHVDLVWASTSTSVPLLKGGTVKALGFAAPKPFREFPDIPALPARGMPEMDIPFWHALFAPAGTPEPIVQKLNAALRQAMADPQVQKVYADLGLEAFPPDQLTPEAARALVHSEIERWGKVVRENNIQGTP